MAVPPPLSVTFKIHSFDFGNTQGLYDFVMSLDAETLRNLSPEDRYTILTRLDVKKDSHTKAELLKRDIVATTVLATCPYPAGYEALEDDWLFDLLKRPSTIDVLRSLNRRKKLDDNELLPLSRKIIADQVESFRYVSGTDWARMPRNISTFSLSREDFEKLSRIDPFSVHAGAVCFDEKPSRASIRHFPGLKRHRGACIAFNINADMRPRYADDISYLATHEMVHLISFDGTKADETHNPYADMAKAIKIEKRLYSFVVRNFGPSVYRSLLCERIAYSFCQKYTYAVHRMLRHWMTWRRPARRKIPTERAILLSSLSSDRYDPKIAKTLRAALRLNT